MSLIDRCRINESVCDGKMCGDMHSVVSAGCPVTVDTRDCVGG